MKYIYISIILLIAILVFKCDSKEPNPRINYKPYDVLVEVHDTILIVDTFNHYNIDVDSVYLTHFDTVINDYNYKMSEYHYKINDSLLDGVIVALSPFKPVIDFNYKVKSFTVKDSIILKENNYSGFLYGADISVSPMLSQASIGAAYQFKKGSIINISVGRELNNNYTFVRLGFKKRF